MLTKRVCLILGAGASVPYAFPTGGDLLKFAHNPDSDWWPVAHELFRADATHHASFVTHLVRSGAASLDEFIGKQPHFRDYALGLIAYKIGACESRATLLGANSENDWMRFFIRRLVDGVKLEELPNTRLSIVTFNFDRCFEEALFLRLSAWYQQQDGEVEARRRVADVIREASWPIVHVHGSLGPLPEISGGGRAYEPTREPKIVLEAAQRLKLLDDADNDSQEFQAARKHIANAEIVIFLGFAFHRLNCKRVLPEPWNSRPGIFGTVKNMSTGSVEKARQYFSQRGQPNPRLENMDCLELLLEIENAFSD